MSEAAIVIVVDDDQSVRESLPELIREVGYSSRAYSSAEEFLASEDLYQANCLILDVAMPGMTGPELQAKLQGLRKNIPIIFITAMQNEPMRRTLLEEGAAACLIKPFGNRELLERIELVLEAGAF